MQYSTQFVDGKKFFKEARTRLSFEDFNKFLNNIKQLNSNQQSKKETLERAKEIFGRENEHLYVDFTNLLIRHDSR